MLEKHRARLPSLQELMDHLAVYVFAAVGTFVGVAEGAVLAYKHIGTELLSKEGRVRLYHGNKSHRPITGEGEELHKQFANQAFGKLNGFDTAHEDTKPVGAGVVGNKPYDASPIDGKHVEPPVAKRSAVEPTIAHNQVVKTPPVATEMDALVLKPPEPLKPDALNPADSNTVQVPGGPLKKVEDLSPLEAHAVSLLNPNAIAPEAYDSPPTPEREHGAGMRTVTDDSTLSTPVTSAPSTPRAGDEHLDPSKKKIGKKIKKAFKKMAEPFRTEH